MYNQLTREQRYGIYLGIEEGKTQSAIARQIGVNRSTVSREIRRNSNRHGRYWWSIAHERALDRRERTVRNREKPADVLWEAGRLLIAEEWSPRQISGWLKKRDVRISHERILLDNGEASHGMDHGKVADAVIRLLYPYRKNVLTITTDNGFEFRSHRKIKEALKATVYFADSYSSWQKGGIENMNKLIRQYIPKGTDFRELCDEFIRSVQLKLNRKPREKLNFSTPKDEFFRLLL